MSDLEQRLEELEAAMTKERAESVTEMIVDSDPVKMNYLDLKRDTKLLAERMQVLQKELDKELSIAAMNGMTPETGDRIVSIQREINLSQEKTQRNLETIQSIEEKTRSNISSKSKEIGEKISGSLNKVKENLMDKLVAGVSATKAISSKVREANENVMERGAIAKDTMNTNLEESVHQISRNWMSFNYQKNMVLSNSLDKLADTMTKVFERSSNIKEAFKDLGRALSGKDRQHTEASISDRQQGIVNKIRGMSENLRAEMGNLEKEFNMSRDLSLMNLQGAREFREESKQDIKENNGLEKRFSQAKEASISLKKESKEVTKEIESKDMDL